MKTIKSGILLILCTFFLFSCQQENKVSPAKESVADKKALPETLRLYARLQSELERGIMLGHQDALAYGNNWFGEAGRSDVKSVCGDYPAVFGWDLGKIENGGTHNVDSVPFTAIRSYVQQADGWGGISTFSWHADNPATGGDYADTSCPDVVKLILEDPDTQARFLRSLDRVADFFAQLKDDNGLPIPVIFRPFHEHNAGTSFWWNTEQCSPDDFKSLWKLTADYLQNSKHIHNLLYAYSVYCADDADKLAACYPGNDYADIVGLGSHWLQPLNADRKQFIHELNRNLAVTVQFAEQNNKIPAITNTGLEGVKISNFFSEHLYPVISQYKLSYVLFWRNAWNMEKHYFIPVPGHPAGEDFVRFTNYPDILTCKELKR